MGLSYSGFEGCCGGDFDVGSDAGRFPVGFGIWIDGAVFGDGYSIVIVDAMEYACVRAASGGFTDDGGAL